MKIRFLISAMEDMRSIKAYIARDNPEAAVRMIKRIKAAVKHLGKFPNSGRIIPESNIPQLREIIVSNYRIMYQVSESAINVFAVYEGHRLHSL
ncbi:MAG: type II toxin-antitoxin system RelE/ParE family toxin [Spirochaetales bacterium]|nr:type II toxin-antitoxin system RelE/ParE family toxin [Spirochaetales bacterium]